jgi:hypothetical protein
MLRFPPGVGPTRSPTTPRGCQIAGSAPDSRGNGPSRASCQPWIVGVAEKLAVAVFCRAPMIAPMIAPATKRTRKPWTVLVAAPKAAPPAPPSAPPAIHDVVNSVIVTCTTLRPSWPHAFANSASARG